MTTFPPRQDDAGHVHEWFYCPSCSHRIELDEFLANAEGHIIVVCGGCHGVLDEIELELR